MAVQRADGLMQGVGTLKRRGLVAGATTGWTWRTGLLFA